MGNDDQGNPSGKPILDRDGKPYTTLGYQNGSGAITSWPRPLPSADPKAAQQALVPTGDTFNGTASLSETHGGEDVPLYAIGAGSEHVHGVIEQNRIFNFIMAALGYGTVGQPFHQSRECNQSPQTAN